MIMNLLLNRYVASMLAFIVIVTGIFWYVSYNRNTIKNLSMENSILKSSVDQQKEVIEVLKKDIEKIIQLNKDIASKTQKLQKEKESLKEALFRETQGKRPIDELARAKPKLVENAVNNGTDKALKCLESVSSNKDCQ